MDAVYVCVCIGCRHTHNIFNADDEDGEVIEWTEDSGVLNRWCHVPWQLDISTVSFWLAFSTSVQQRENTLNSSITWYHITYQKCTWSLWVRGILLSLTQQLKRLGLFFLLHMYTCNGHIVNHLFLLSIACVSQRFPEHDHKELIKNLNQKC